MIGAQASNDQYEKKVFMTVERVSCTETAQAVIEQLRLQHGALLFYQNGGCCDGSAPMCFAQGDFLIGVQDVYLGAIHGCPFYMAVDQFEFYKNTHITVDVTKGSGASFSLEIPLGLRFIAISRLLTEAELNAIQTVE